MTYRFCPGHVSCVFQPFPSSDPVMAGSRGFGIRLSLGAHCTAEPRPDGVVRIVIDGEECQAPVTRHAVLSLAGDMGLDIRISNDLPVSQGFGMSAAGALSAALCVCDILDLPEHDAVVAAHSSDVCCGGGLGDVVAIAECYDIPIRVLPGVPPYGRMEGMVQGMDNITLAVLGQKMVTGSVLKDPVRMERIREVSGKAMGAFLDEPTVDSLYEQSNVFSSQSGLESPQVHDALGMLHSEGYRAGMCMLGNSIFTDAPGHVVRDLLGLDEGDVFVCTSYPDPL